MIRHLPEQRIDAKKMAQPKVIIASFAVSDQDISMNLRHQGITHFGTPSRSPIQPVQYIFEIIVCRFNMNRRMANLMLLKD